MVVEDPQRGARHIVACVPASAFDPAHDPTIVNTVQVNSVQVRIRS
ncbi:hypothetical protein N136_04779 [Leifsonia aquatica ATCC 14665]|uniref:Uncharacterized protein n=1 Tax=Leifsonia aquatica ATCC 14665 TaxID=1358026 RepID=U2QRV4_LEIAQ|nr:hypothetical protein N136_04779 [Leifsonia aquatica ATCC 14665]